MENQSEYLLCEDVFNHGFVELIDVMGSDQAIVNAARTSYAKGTKKVSSTKQLMRYLLRHNHSGPFEFGVCVFRIRCPLFVARQWFRHRTASYNEVSLRYSEAQEDFYIPEEEWITTQDRRNRQARTEEEIVNAQKIRNMLNADAKVLLEHYNYYLSEGVAREIARINLPLSLYTTFTFKMDIRNLLHFLLLRTDPHAQFEIRQYALIMENMIEKYFPFVIEAWRDYYKHAITFSKPEISILKEIFQSKLNLLEEVQEYLETNQDSISLAKLEQMEFIDKIKLLLGEELDLNYLGKRNQ
ncbi:MAG: FAD-dependent thymidylate synthase [Promethearchaeota archaeon]